MSALLKDAPAPKVTSSEVQAALRLRYPAGQHALLWEVADSTGGNARRFADAVAIGLWPSHGHEVEGIEVKVSRGDWLRELANHEKSQAVFQYCNRFWLACPKGMVQPAELPPTWGLLELVGDVLRVKVKAPALKPVRMPMGFIASLLRRSAGCDEEMTRATVYREVQQQTQKIRERLEREHRAHTKHEVETAKRALESLEEIKQATGIDLTAYKPSEHWVAGIRFACSDRWGKAFTAEKCAAVSKQLAELQDALAVFADTAPAEPGEEDWMPTTAARGAGAGAGGGNSGP